MRNFRVFVKRSNRSGGFPIPASRSILIPMRRFFPLNALVLAAMATVAGPSLAADVGFAPINHQRLVQLSPSEVWSRVHDFLQDQGFDVVKEDQASGLIESRRLTPKKGALAHFADCPSKLFWSTKHQVTDLNIIIKPAPDGSRVTVNAAFLEAGKPGKKGLPELACVSQGVLESAVLEVAGGQPMEAAVIPH